MNHIVLGDYMERFDLTFDQNGHLLLPKTLKEKVNCRNFVMVFHEGEIRIVPKIKLKNFMGS